ncbi:hypothetical protein [Streptomyces sp. 2A115]
MSRDHGTYNLLRADRVRMDDNRSGGEQPVDDGPDAKPPRHAR